jgi:hypothetical protein
MGVFWGSFRQGPKDIGPTGQLGGKPIRSVAGPATGVAKDTKATGTKPTECFQLVRCESRRSRGYFRQRQTRRRIRIDTVGPHLLVSALRRLKQNSGWFSVLSRLVRELDARLDRRQLIAECLFLFAGFDRPFSSTLQDEDLYNMSHLAQATEQPDQQDDRQRNANQPQQKTATHFHLLIKDARTNARFDLGFRTAVKRVTKRSTWGTFLIQRGEVHYLRRTCLRFRGRLLKQAG